MGSMDSGTGGYFPLDLDSDVVESYLAAVPYSVLPMRKPLCQKDIHNGIEEIEDNSHRSSRTFDLWIWTR